MKRPMVLISAVLVLGIFLARQGLPLLAGGVLTIILLGLILIIYKKQILREVSRLESLVLLCCLPGILFLGMWRYSMCEKMYLRQAEVATSLTEFNGKVLGIENKNGKKVITIEGADGKMLLYFDEQILSENGILTDRGYLSEKKVKEYELIGSRINCIGKLSLFPKATNEGQFNSYLYHMNRGEIAMVSSPVIMEISFSRHNPWIFIKQNLYRLRLALGDVYSYCLPGEEASLMSALTLGNRSGLDDDVKNLFQMAGLIHLLSVSSTHIGCVSRSLYKLLRRWGISYPITGIISGMVAILYGTMCGNSISCIRAVGMFLIFAYGNALGEAYDSLSSIGFLSFSTLLIHPTYLFDTGFLFSYGAVLGVVLVASPMKKSYENHCKKKWEEIHRVYPGHTYLPSLREFIIGQVLFSLGVQIATLPLVAQFFYEIPTYVCLLNLLILPIFPFLLIWGLLGSLLNLILPIPWILYPCHMILFSMEAAADLSLRLPMARVIIGAPGLVWALIYYVALLLLIEGLKRNYQYRFLLSMAFLVMPFFIPRIPYFEVNLLDVGQGLGACITCQNGVHLFIDGGSSSVTNVGQYRILPYLKYNGIRKMDYWFISHLDQDHYSGFLEVLDSDYQIENVVLAEGVVKDSNWEELITLLEDKGIDILYVKPGNELHIGKDKIKVLSPEENMSTTDRNDASLVVELVNDVRFLFPGDISGDVEKTLSQKGLLSDIDFLIASHHGSNYSSCEDFLDELTPEYIFYSAGKNNRYGHPGEQTMERVEERGIEEYCTIETGQISIYKNKKIRPFR